MRNFGIALLATTVIALSSNAVHAQIVNPWGYGSQPNPWVYNPIPPGASYNAPFIGRLPNGTPVVNPWIRPTVYPVIPAPYFNYGVQYNYQTILNPSLYLPGLYNYNYSQYRSFNFGVNGFNNIGFNNFNNFNNFGYYNLGTGIAPQGFYQQEVGRVIPVSNDLAINPISGTVLRASNGIALTREGPFYRIPGTGSLSPWGRFIPGSGVYVNPFSGAAYDPVSGVIAR